MYPLFELSCILCLKQTESRKQRDTTRIVNYAWTDVTGRSILALIINNGNILLYYTARDRPKPVLREISWCENYSNHISALCFDPTGSWLVCAAKDATLFIVPALSLLDATIKVDHLWSLDDVTKIEMLGKRGDPPPNISSSRTSASDAERAPPTCLVWWQTMDNKSVAIVGNELGEICFINLITHQEVGGTYITTGIVNLHLIRDDTHDTVYLLITGVNNLQWQLLLEKPTIGYQWPLELESDGREGARMKEKGHVQVDHRPHRLNRFAGHTQLKPQSARGRHFVAGHYGPNSILCVHSVDLNIAPLFVYKLPAGATNILLTDRLLFITTKNQLMILSNQLSETAIDGKKDADPNAKIQSFHLHSDEHVLGTVITSGAKLINQKTMASKHGPRSVPSSPRFSARIRRPSGSLGPALGSTNSRKRFSIFDHRNENRLDDIKIPTTRLNGCLIIMETMVFECRPRMAPERLFLELVLTQDLKSSEKLGVTLGLDVNKLYETTADYQLSQGHFAAAVRLYQLSKCPHVRSVANFAAHGCVGELLSYVRVLFSNQGVEFPLSDRRHFANMELLCYVHQILELKVGSSSLSQAFHHFLHDNRHYSEPLAVQLLADQGFFELLAVMTENRGLLTMMLEELLRPDSVSWLNESTSAILDARSYGTLLRGIKNDGYLKCLTMPSIIQIFYPNSTLSIAHCVQMNNLMAQLNVDFLLRLATLYDPSRPCLRMYLKQILNQQHTEEFKPQNEDLAWELLVIETFILSLLFLDFRRSTNSEFDFTFVGETCKFTNKFPVSPSKRPRLPRRSSPVGCGLAHAAVIRNGAVFTWGKTDHCCLGCGHMTQECSPPLCIDLFISLGTKVISIACGAWHTLALTNIGVFAWGMSKYGQLGVGVADKHPRPVLIECLVDEHIVAVTCGQFHSLALTADGRVYSWGWGVHGQLGHCSSNDESYPRLLKFLQKEIIVKVSAGYGHSAVLTAKGDVYTFGCSMFGQLGNGNTNKSSIPVKVELPEKINLISCGYFHNVVITASNHIYTWGSNPQQLRLQAQASRRARLQSKTQQVESSETLRTDNYAVIMGPQNHLLPIIVDNNEVASPIIQVACGSHHSAVLTMDGEVYTWGRNLDGQLGNGSRKEQRLPIRVNITEKITHIGCGSDFTIAVDSDGRVWGWGQNDCGQVGLDIDNTSSGKTITIKTNRRIVQLRNTQQWGVVKPQQIGGLAISRMMHQFEPIKNSEMESDVGNKKYWYLKKLHPLIKFETPAFGSKTLHLILEVFDGRYCAEKIMDYANKLRIFHVCAKLAYLQNDYSRSLKFNLQALSVSPGYGSTCKTAISLVEFYLKLISQEDHEIAKQLLENITNYWLDYNLPLEDLEMFLANKLPYFVHSISSLLLIPQSSDSRLPSLLGRMSTRFCLSLASTLLVHLKSGTIDPRFLQLLTSHAKNRSSMHTTREETLTDAITLRPRQLEKLVHLLEQEGAQSPSAARVLLFTCGHHYTSFIFMRTVLPHFEASMRTLPIPLTRTTQALLASYSSDSLQPMACPRCVFVRIKESI